MLQWNIYECRIFNFALAFTYNIFVFLFVKIEREYYGIFKKIHKTEIFMKYIAVYMTQFIRFVSSNYFMKLTICMKFFTMAIKQKIFTNLWNVKIKNKKKTKQNFESEQFIDINNAEHVLNIIFNIKYQLQKSEAQFLNNGIR